MFSYNESGNLTTFIDRKGQSTTFGYDVLNRKAGAVYADGGAVRYRYDVAGRLMEVDDSESGTIAYEYATFGQCRGCSGKSLDKIIQETTPMGTIHHTYDSLGRRTSMTAAWARPLPAKVLRLRGLLCHWDRSLLSRPIQSINRSYPCLARLDSFLQLS